jgi:chloramphenicol-sensitive protein RarD
MNSPESGSQAPAKRNNGFMLGLGAYALWGILPIYFKQIPDVPPVDIVAHRVLWSIPLLAALLIATSRGPVVSDAIRQRKTLALLTVTALLIAVNWLL